MSFVVFMLIVRGWKTIGPYKYGLLKNGVTGQVYLTGDNVVREPGVHYVGFWNSFLTFPSTIQTIQYSFEKPEEGVQHLTPLHLRSKDAVPIYLEVSVQYRRIKDKLPELFQSAMTPLLQENIFASELRAELTKVMSEHIAADCWKEREQLIQEFTHACEEVLEPQHAECWGLQFYRVKLADKYEDELISTQVQKQQERIEEAKKNAAEVRADTKVVLANYTNDIKVLEAAGAAKRYNLQVSAQTQAEVNKVNAEANALKYVMQTLTLDNGMAMTETQLTEYQKALMLGASLTNSHLYYGLASSPQYIAMPRRLQTSEQLQQPAQESDADRREL